MKKATVSLFLSLMVFGSFAVGQTKKIRWESTGGMCKYEGTYNTKKYSAEQIKNTLKLINGYFRLDTFNATVFKYEEISRQDFAPIEAEYQKKSAELKNLNIIKTPYWENRKQQQIKEMDSYYWLSKTTMAGYRTPVSLRDYPYANSCKTKFAEPVIAGGNSLLKAWEIVNLEQRRNNGDPARIKREFDQQRKSPNAMKYAIVEVLTFGWWNCANALIDQGEDDSVLEKNFKKIFTRVRTIYCEQP